MNFVRESDALDEIDVDGYVDRKGVRFIGKAKRQPDGTYLCLADVGGALCRVEAHISLRAPWEPAR
jgi:hypothetical protein